MLHTKNIFKLLTLVGIFIVLKSSGQGIPLPEHPRPDFVRSQWLNLNGDWNFSFDSENVGIDQQWFHNHTFDQEIRVPFPWGSKLSGVENEGEIAWYNRTIQVPDSFSSKRVFLIIGASDWITDVWIDGNHLGTHQGGYTPFEFDLTPYLSSKTDYEITVRVDDSHRNYKLEGKQGYGEAKGIWQTVYLETRGAVAMKTIHFTPDIDNGKLMVKVKLDQPAPETMSISLTFPNKELSVITSPRLKKSQQEIEFEVEIPKMHLWSLDDPYLYDVTVGLHSKDQLYDEVQSYFGMRKISVSNLPGTNYPYVTLNNQPVYLQLCLDQSYHPEGFYTFPSDQFMRDEIIRSKKIGLNGNRIHIKTELPRKLYWADKLGLLIMADVPNWWGEPCDEAFAEWEVAMRGMIERDYNHPAIFQWVLFNETWGLFSGKDENRKYLPDTQERVKNLYVEAKKMDKSRLIEDNSTCNYDHTITDVNSWHAYLPGYKWASFLDGMDENTYTGSKWNFIGNNKQTAIPMINSECGNVWGYEGSTGDVDWSWDYHIMMNEFRKHPKMAGWLYTEHHDVINEWNGYYKFDRTDKITGIDDFVPGMDLNQLHSLVYLSTGSELCKLVQPGSTVKVPLYLSVMTDEVPVDHFILDYELAGVDNMGNVDNISTETTQLPSSAYFNGPVDSIAVKMPNMPGLYNLKLKLHDENGYVYHLNFTSFLVDDSGWVPAKSIVSFDPASFVESSWSEKQWNVMEDLKVNGAGYGYFTYKVVVPEEISLAKAQNVTLIFEASANELLGKDQDNNGESEGDFMRGNGTFNNSLNSNAYPMTDTYKNPSIVKVRINGVVVDEFYLEDDPADHRGVLSWYSQKRDLKLNEAGTYGYLCKVKIPVDLLKQTPRDFITIQFEVDEALPRGLAIYGKRFGRYPFDPTLIIE